MTEQLRFRISLHVSGLFYPFALHPGCPGSAWLSPVKVPVVGTLTRCEPQPASPPGLILQSARIVRSATVHTAHACSRDFSLGKAPGLRTDAVCAEYRGVVQEIAANGVTVFEIGPDNFR
jgi:hypothetical protein